MQEKHSRACNRDWPMSYRRCTILAERYTQNKMFPYCVLKTLNCTGYERRWRLFQHVFGLRVTQAIKLWKELISKTTHVFRKSNGNNGTTYIRMKRDKGINKWNIDICKRVEPFSCVKAQRIVLGILGKWYIFQRWTVGLDKEYFGKVC